MVVKTEKKKNTTKELHMAWENMKFKGKSVWVEVQEETLKIQL